MSERQSLMQQIQMYGFALADVTLFLDSHPEDAAGLAYYYEHKKLYDDAVTVYEHKYGPLTNRNNTNPYKWTWTDGPWPWEREA